MKVLVPTYVGGLTTHEGASVQIDVRPNKLDLIPTDEGLSPHMRAGSQLWLVIFPAVLFPGYIE